MGGRFGEVNNCKIKLKQVMTRPRWPCCIFYSSGYSCLHSTRYRTWVHRLYFFPLVLLLEGVSNSPRNVSVTVLRFAYVMQPFGCLLYGKCYTHFVHMAPIECLFELIVGCLQTVSTREAHIEARISLG